MWHIRPQTHSQSSLFICTWSWEIGTSSPRRAQRFLRGLFLSKGDWGEEKMMGMTMGRKKRLAFSLFPSSTASYFFSLFLLEYRAEAPAKDYVHHFPCFFTKTATVLKGFRVLVTKWLWLHFGTLFHGKQVRNDWEICWFQLSFMVLYLIWNEISHFWFVKTRKRQIDIELFCSLLSGHCVDQFYPANKKKTSKFGQGQLIMKFKHQKENRYKRKSKVHFPLYC